MLYGLSIRTTVASNLALGGTKETSRETRDLEEEEEEKKEVLGKDKDEESPSMSTKFEMFDKVICHRYSFTHLSLITILFLLFSLRNF